MAAVLTTQPTSDRILAPGLERDAWVERLPSYVRAPGARPSTLTFWRRRVLALVVLAVALAALVVIAPRFRAAPGGVPASTSRGGPVPRVYVVQPGDSVWTIARRIQPNGDPRAVVAAIQMAHGSSALQVGESLALAG